MTPRTPCVLAILMALSCSMAQGHAMDPDSTWWVGENEVCWDAPTPPPGVRISGYQLVRGVEVTPADGGPPELQWVPWGPVIQDIGGKFDGGCLQVDTFEIDVTEYIVDVLHWHHTPTTIRRRTWGEVKRTLHTVGPEAVEKEASP